MKKNINEIFSSIERYTTFKNDVVVWLGLRIADKNAIDFAYPDIIASTRYGKDSIHFEKQFALLSVEKHTKIRSDSSLKELNSYLEGFLSSLKNNKVYIVPYHSTNYLERIISKHPNIELLAPPYKIKKFLDKKSYVKRILSKIGIKCVPGLEERISGNYNEQFERLARKLEFPFVLQLDDSNSGSGTYLIENFSDFYEVCSKNLGKNAIFSKYVEGKSMNINAVRTRNFVILSEPSLQIIGEKSCTPRRFGYCGNDFNIGSKISEEQLKEIFETTKKIGNWLGSIGYYGIFGIDFIVDDRDVYFTEINPRFQGSTSLLVDRQHECKKIPLSFFHIVPYLDGLSVDERFVHEYNKDIRPLNVSQILLHNLSGEDVTLKSSLLPGRYAFENGNLHYLGKANYLSETKTYDEIVIAGELPVDGTKILKDSDEICRIYSYKEVVDKNGKLNDYGKNLAKAVYSKLELIPNE